MAGYANWHSGQVESLMFVGSTPTLVTAEWTGVGSQRGLISRSTPVRIRPPQLDGPVVEWKDAPLIRGRAVVRSHPGLLSGTHVPRVASLSCKQTGVGSIPTASTERKVAGYGWPGRGANAVSPCGECGFDSLTFRWTPRW